MVKWRTLEFPEIKNISRSVVNRPDELIPQIFSLRVLEKGIELMSAVRRTMATYWCFIPGFIALFVAAWVSTIYSDPGPTSETETVGNLPKTSYLKLSTRDYLTHFTYFHFIKFIYLFKWLLVSVCSCLFLLLHHSGHNSRNLLDA